MAIYSSRISPRAEACWRCGTRTGTERPTIAANVAPDEVIAVTAEQAVVLRAAEQNVAAGAAVEPIVVEAAFELVVARGAEQTVVATERDQQVVAGQTRDRVGLRNAIPIADELVGGHWFLE